MKPRRVLVVSPVFHGYWSAIAAALRELGLEVVSHCYDTGPGYHGIVNAVAHRLTSSPVPGAERLATVGWRAATQRAVEVVQTTRPDAALIIKADRLGADFWDALDDSAVPSVVWLYDELRRMAYEPGRLARAGAVMSYSPKDAAALRAEGIDACVLPDGYDSLTRFQPVPLDAVTFVGARYPERERVLRMVQAAGTPVVAYGREWSRHPWDVVRTGQRRPAGVPARRDLSRPDYYGVMAGSLATLNVHGDGHDGLSMRTFEAPGVGAVSLIDRPAVAEFYDVGTETLLFGTDAELIDQLERIRTDRRWADAIRLAGARRTAAEHTLVHRMRQVVARWA